MKHGQLIARLRENFRERLEEVADGELRIEVQAAFDMASLHTLVEAYEGNGEPVQEALSPQKRAAMTRKANQRKREKSQVKTALGVESTQEERFGS